MEDALEYISQFDIILAKRPIFLCNDEHPNIWRYSYDTTYHLEPRNGFSWQSWTRLRMRVELRILDPEVRLVGADEWSLMIYVQQNLRNYST